MAPPDSAKIALGVLAAAGLGVLLYLLIKRQRGKSKSSGFGDSGSPDTAFSVPHLGQGEAEEELVAKDVTSTETVPKIFASDEKESSALSESRAGLSDSSLDDSWKKLGRKEEEEESAAAVETDTSSASTLMTPLTSSETDMRETEVRTPDSLLDPNANIQAADSRQREGETTGEDKQELATALEASAKAEASSAADNSRNGEGAASSSEQKVAESVGDDATSLRSTNSDPLSFERINSNDDVHSSEGSEGKNGVGVQSFDFLAGKGFDQPGSFMDTLQSFEQIGGSNTESLQSFEQISELGQSATFEPIESSMEVIGSLPKVEQSAAEKSGGGEQSSSETSDEQNGNVVEQTQEASSAASEDLSKEKEEGQEPSESETQSDPHASRSETQIAEEADDPPEDASEETVKEDPSADDPGPSSRGSRDDESSSSEREPSGGKASAGRGALSEGESIESFQSAGLTRDFYSSDSVMSFHTAASNTSGSQLDFYSPISSPESASVENLTGKYNVNPDTGSEFESGDELTFEEAKPAAESPQDRTPTNTPLIPDFPSGDDDLAKTPQDSWANDSKEVFSTPVGKHEHGEAGDEDRSGTPKREVNGEKASQSPAAEPRPWALSIDKDKMTAAILQAQSAPDKMEIGQLQVLTQMLQLEDRALLNTALECIVRATTFTINVNILRVCECPKELVRLLETLTTEVLRDPEAAKEGEPSTEALLLSTVRAVTNLAMDIKTQPQLEGGLPLLSDLLLSEGITENVTLATLQPLTNLSSTPAYHGHFTRILHQLYGLLDTSHNSALRLQCLKVLVNLSLNADMVPHMLAAKAPECLLELIDINCDVDLLLRTVTFVANVMSIMQEQGITASKLPADEKAASPETMYAALFAHDRRDALRNKVYRLTRHESEDVCYQASRLYKFITTAAK